MSQYKCRCKQAIRNERFPLAWCVHTADTETDTVTESDTDTDKLVQNPMLICVDVCL